MNVTFTPKARAFMRRIVRMFGGGTGAGFRLEVSRGGCSGLASQFDVEPEPKPADVVLESDGVRVFLSQSSCQLLKGATVDFFDTRTASGFYIAVPNAPKACAAVTAAPPAVAFVELRRIRHVE